MSRYIPWLKLRAASCCSIAAVLTAFLGVSAQPGCSSSPEKEAPCDGALKEACGKGCSQVADCGEGLYCGSSSTCTADCTPSGGECGDGRTCASDGRCVAVPDDGFGENVDEPPQLPGVDPGEETCADVKLDLGRQTPTVMLLIDQSGSMNEGFGGNGSRWDVMKRALLDPATGLVKSLQDQVRFGLALYTSHNGSAGGACPLLTSVSVSLGNYDAIKSTFDAARPDDDTPTGDSIQAVAAELAQVTEPGAKVIVLATDGEPDSCARPDPQTAQPESVAAAGAAYAQGIKTVIISVGGEIGRAHLQDVANAGAGFQSGGANNAPFYEALDQASLIDAFRTIIDGVRGCVFTLNGAVNDALGGTVLLDGEQLGINDPNGWKLNGASEIELLGEACQKVQEGNHQLEAKFTCGSVEVPR